MAPPSGSPRRRGPERTLELLKVTLELAADVGYRGLSIEAIARRAGVGKHTISRRWPSLSDLLLDALTHAWISDLDYHDSGGIREDLREQFLRSTRALSSAPLGPIYRAVVADAQSDARLREIIHTRFLATVERRTLERVRLAQRHGELGRIAHVERVVEILVGSLYYRWLLSTLPVDEEPIDALIDLFLAAYAAPTD